MLRSCLVVALCLLLVAISSHLAYFAIESARRKHALRAASARIRRRLVDPHPTLSEGMASLWTIGRISTTAGMAAVVVWIESNLPLATLAFGATMATYFIGAVAYRQLLIVGEGRIGAGGPRWIRIFCGLVAVVGIGIMIQSIEILSQVRPDRVKVNLTLLLYGLAIWIVLEFVWPVSPRLFQVRSGLVVLADAALRRRLQLIDERVAELQTNRAPAKHLDAARRVLRRPVARARLVGRGAPTRRSWFGIGVCLRRPGVRRVPWPRPG